MCGGSHRRRSYASEMYPLTRPGKGARLALSHTCVWLQPPLLAAGFDAFVGAEYKAYYLPKVGAPRYRGRSKP